MLPPGGGVKGTGRGSRAASLPASPRPPREVAPGRLSLEGAGMCLSQSRVWGLGLYLHPHDAEPALREASSCTRGRRLVPCEWEGSGEESAPAPAALVCLRMPSSQIAQPSAPHTHHSVRWYSDTHTCTQVHTHTQVHADTRAHTHADIHAHLQTQAHHVPAICTHAHGARQPHGLTFFSGGSLEARRMLPRSGARRPGSNARWVEGLPHARTS